MYPVNDVERGYLYYKQLLLGKLLQLFEYKNLPETLPQEELEYRILKNGVATVFYHPIYKLVTATGGLANVGIYNHPTEFIYSQVVLSRTDDKKKRIVGVDCVPIYDNYTDSFQGSGISTSFRTVMRYAQLLADVDSSTQICTVNTRQTNLFKAIDGKNKSEIEEFYSRMRKGSFSVIHGTNQGLFQGVEVLPFAENGDKTLASLTTTRRDILANFYEEFGISHKRDKVAEMTATEVGESEQVLSVNLESMLASRQKGVDKINSIFSTQISVDINKKIKGGLINDTGGIYGTRGIADP